MTVQAKIITGETKLSHRLSGAVKFYRDVCSVLEIKMLLLVRGWHLHLIRPLVLPLAVFFWLRVVAPDDPQVVRRILTGAIIFGFALSTVNMLAQQLINDRFAGRQKLFVTMPMSKAAYAVGVLAFGAVQAAPMVVLILALARMVEADFQLVWVFFPLLASVLLTMGGLTFLIASWAPSQEAGGILANLFGIVLVLVSPVFFTMDQAPMLIRWLGWVSPMRYAADGVMKSLSGRPDVWAEFAILAGFCLATMSLGLWKLRWRER